MIALLSSLMVACIFIGAARCWRKHPYWGARLFWGALDGAIVGFVLCGVLYCAWQVFKFWVGLGIIAAIFGTQVSKGGSPRDPSNGSRWTSSH